MSRRRLFCAFALAVAAAMAAPVGAGATAAARSPKQRLAHSAQATADAGSANLNGDIEVNAAGLSVGVKLDGTFELGPDAKNGVLTMDLGGLLGSSPLEVRVVDGDYYISLASFAALIPNLPKGKQWARATADEFQQFGSTGADPTGQIGAFRGARNVHVVGNEDVNGVTTTHFTGVIDVNAALRATPPAQRARLRQSLQSLGSKKLAFDVWLDEKDRVNKFMFSFKIRKSGTLGAGHATLELSDFGVEVNVEAPPADQVIPYSQLQDLTSGSSQ